MKAYIIGACLLLSLLTTAGCTQREREELPESNAVYYWRTELRLDSLERSFLSRHHVSRLYCRYFDVVMADGRGPVPNATISFSDTLPDGIELIPTVFITEDCMHEKHEGLAGKIVKRIAQMNETNDIKGVREIQIDCDYTARSRQTYYEFLESVRHKWASLIPPSTTRLQPTVSTTIRLHQLSMPAPPVDEGVLMLYNTGSLEKSAERNPILDLRDVLPYVPCLKDYDLPLSAAYPVFLWQRRVYGVSIEHVADMAEVARVKQAVEAKRDDLRSRIVIYDLSEENINRYKPNDYEAIYRH